MSLRTSGTTLAWPLPGIPSGHNPFPKSLPLGVVLRAANQNDNDCQWQSYLNAAQTGVAIPRFFENRRWSAKAPLADQGWCSAQRIQILMTAGGSHTIVYAIMAVAHKAMTEGIRTYLF